MVVGCAVEGSSIIAGGGDAFSKIVALRLRVVSSKPFPIDFVEAIGLQDGSADNSCAWSGFHNKVDMAKHNVPVGREGWRVAVP